MPTSDKFYENQRGIAAYIVALIFGLVLLMVFFIFTNVIKDLSIQTKESDSSRAFSAAEAGVEALIVGGGGVISDNFDNFRSSYEAAPEPLGEGETEYLYPDKLDSGESASMWLVSHNDSGGLECSSTKPCFTGSSFYVCWNEGAVEVSVYYTDSLPFNGSDFSSVKVARFAYDTVSSRNNNFSAASAGTCNFTSEGLTLDHRQTISKSAISAVCGAGSCQPILVSVRSLYNTTQQNIGFLAISGTFPSQGVRYNSLGTSAQANTRVVVDEPYAGIPAIFDAALFSPNDIVKNTP